jgi:hypothetical protein
MTRYAKAAGMRLTILGAIQLFDSRDLGVCGAQSPGVFSYTLATLCCPLTQPSQRSRQAFSVDRNPFATPQVRENNAEFQRWSVTTPCFGSLKVHARVLHARSQSHAYLGDERMPTYSNGVIQAGSSIPAVYKFSCRVQDSPGRSFARMMTFCRCTQT